VLPVIVIKASTTQALGQWLITLSGSQPKSDSKKPAIGILLSVMVVATLPTVRHRRCLASTDIVLGDSVNACEQLAQRR